MLNPRIISNHGFIKSSKRKSIWWFLKANYWMFLKHNWNENFLFFTRILSPNFCIILNQHFGLVPTLYRQKSILIVWNCKIHSYTSLGETNWTLHLPTSPPQHSAYGEPSSPFLHQRTRFHLQDYRKKRLVVL